MDSAIDKMCFLEQTGFNLGDLVSVSVGRGDVVHLAVDDK